MEQTLAIIKPDGVRKGIIGELLARIEKGGLKFERYIIPTADHE